MGLCCTLREQNGTASILVTEPAWLTQLRATRWDHLCLAPASIKRGAPHSILQNSNWIFFQLLSELEDLERSIFCSLIEAMFSFSHCFYPSALFSFPFILPFYHFLPSLLHHKEGGSLEKLLTNNATFSSICVFSLIHHPF